MTSSAAATLCLVGVLSLTPRSSGGTGSGGAVAGEAAAPGPGVSRALARQRAEQLSGIRYDFRLRIPPAMDQPIRGQERLSFHLTRVDEPLVVDFQQTADHVLAVRDSAGHAVPHDVVNGHIVVPAAALHVGDNVLELEFMAGDGSLNRNPDYLYALFVPDRASVALPVFDQPDLKARFTLALDVPGTWVAVSNGAQLARDSGADGVHYRFAETEPIPTYLFTFAAGHWNIATAVRDGRTFHMFHRESDSAKVARNVDAIFDLEAHALHWLEQYTGLPYPFGKFDFVAVPAFQFGGMEHPGAIYYRAESLFLDPSATESQYLGRASLIAHETTHMWFGDLVTMKWFNDVWLKEVFANFMAAKVVNPSFPHVDHALRFYLAHFPAAYAIDRTAGANPIQQPLDNLRNAGTLYGNIIYDKAPIVMQHLEALMGADNFRDGLRRYLRRYAFGNATWSDLVDILDRRTPVDLKAWSHVWVEEPGRPVVAARLTKDAAGRVADLSLVQSDPAGKGRVWPQPVHVLLGYGDSARDIAVSLDAARAAVPGVRGWAAPDFVLPGGDGLAYGEFRLDPQSRAALLARLPSLNPPMARATGWTALWDAMLEGDVAPDSVLDLAERMLPAEHQELIVQRVLADAGTIYWRFLSDAQRKRSAPGLEALVWKRLLAADTATLRATYFHAYENIALTDSAVSRLRGLWSGALKVPGLDLSESDRTTLALDLAVRGVTDADSILAAQLAAIRNPDRRDRLQFLLPAVSADSAVRDSFFSSLKNRANRSHESWVLDGLRLLHHPLRRGSALRFIRPALDMLQEIQRTGDVFFPGRWVDATLEYHNSDQAASAVRAFLADHPDYPPKLREKILQGADGLFRAATILDRMHRYSSQP